MAGVEHLLSKDEEEYFESRGRVTPSGYEETGSTSTVKEDRGSEQEREVISSPVDEPDEIGSDAGEIESRVDDETEDFGDQPSVSEKQSKRDYEKAYGVADSKRQELSKQNQLLQEQLAQMRSFIEQSQRAPKQQADIPNKEEDPLGYYSHQLENMNRTVQEQQRYLHEQAARQKHAQSMQSFVGAYKQSAQEFAAEVPDFKDAYSFLEQSRIKEYVAAGYDRAQAVQLLQEDEMAVAAKAFKDNVNPAERIYNLAVARGYGGTMQESASKLETASKGMKAKSLPRAGAKPAERGYDISRVDQMTDEEFDKFFSQVKSEAKRNGDYKKNYY